jgi:hypothetical protein
VVLDVSEVIDAVKARLVDRGMTFLEDAPIPQTDRQIVLMQAPRVAQMRTVYAFANPVARWLLPLVALLFVAAFVLARHRPRMTVAIGAVVAGNALLIAFVVAVGRQLFTNQLSGTTFGPASTVFYETLSAYLQRGQAVVLWLGLTLMAAGWFASRSRTATTVRGAVRNGLEDAGASLTGGHPVAGAGWVAHNLGWLRAVAVAVAGVVLLWGNQATLQRWWWSLALAVVLLVALQVITGAARGVSAAPAPAAAPTDPVEPPTQRA